MKNYKTAHSFRSVMSLATLVCWIMPIVIICVLASTLLNRNYNRNLSTVTEINTKHAMTQLEIRLDDAMDDCRAVDYSNVIHQAYADYVSGAPEAEVRLAIQDYLNHKFFRTPLYDTVYVSFLPPYNLLVYENALGLPDPEAEEQFRTKLLPEATALAAAPNDDIFFLVLEEHLYMLRNLLDESGSPIAILVMGIDQNQLLQSLLSLDEVVELRIDDAVLPLTSVSKTSMPDDRTEALTLSSQLNGHSIVFTGKVVGLDLWKTLPMLRGVVVSACILVIPMLIIIVLLFRRNIDIPIRTLTRYSKRMRGGERGLQITSKAPNTEFAMLYEDFNVMSRELQEQFQKLYEEQQALQQAKLRALQSQINPHFLNNTLEVINWEARIAGNDRVSSMIEAMTTMLDAAIGRDGSSVIPLMQELKYVDAYLYITAQRMGDRLTIEKQIDPETLDCQVPLLMLQPILENAVEYDLSRTGGHLTLRSRFLEDGKLRLEVEHNGTITPEGWAKIQESMHPTTDSTEHHGRSIGIRNVVNRLALLYGDDACFNICLCTPGIILAEITLPTKLCNNQQR